MNCLFVVIRQSTLPPAVKRGSSGMLWSWGPQKLALLLWHLPKYGRVSKVLYESDYDNRFR